MQTFVLRAIALSGLLWAILRASLQSITIDEAFTYLFFVAKPLRTVWMPSSNNHVLNTLLMWIATHTFGPSDIALRAPALLGAALYIAVCYFLCRNITNRFSLQLPLLICLIFNPFLSDFMVVARGYSLANALFMTAIAIPLWHRVKGRPSLYACCLLASLALGLSFAANFSFAIVDGAAFLALALWAAALARNQRHSISGVILCSALPGLLVALLLCGYPLWYWQKNDIWQGAGSLREMFASLIESSLYQLPMKLQASFLGPSILAAIGLLSLARLAAANRRAISSYGLALAAVFVLTVLINWLAFRLHLLLLPIGRTAIYLVPLATLVAGVIAAMPISSSLTRWLRSASTVAFMCLACYFLGCLRTTYFKEYEWDADLKQVYPVLAHLNHTSGVTDVGVAGLYVAVLNYYRVLSHHETFPEFQYAGSDPSPGKSVYVLNAVTQHQWIEDHKLVVIYHGKITDVVVALKPD